MGPNGEILDANLRRGIPTPIAIFAPGSGHAVLAVDRRENADGRVDYQVYDPWYGTLTWVSRDDVNANSVDVGTGQPRVGYVYEFVAPEPVQVAPEPVQVAPQPVEPQPYPSQELQLFPVPQVGPLELNPLELTPRLPSGS